MKTHPVSVGSLVVGLILLGLAGSWALRQAEVIDGDAARWIFPLLLVGAGVIGVLATAVKGIRTRTRDHDNNDNEGETP